MKNGNVYRHIQFKMLHRGYFTPHRLYRMNPSASQECWRCDFFLPGNFTHIFWGCPVIAKYLEEGLSVVNIIAKLSLVPNMSLWG